MRNGLAGLIFALLLLFITLSAIGAASEIEGKDWTEIPFNVRDIDISNASKGTVNVTVELENPYNFDIAKNIPIYLEFEGNNETHLAVLLAKNNSRVRETFTVPIPFKITFKEINITYTLKAGDISKTFSVSQPVANTPGEASSPQTPTTPTTVAQGRNTISGCEVTIALIGFLGARYIRRIF